MEVRIKIDPNVEDTEREIMQMLENDVIKDVDSGEMAIDGSEGYARIYGTNHDYYLDYTPAYARVLIDGDEYVVSRAFAKWFEHLATEIERAIEQARAEALKETKITVQVAP